MYKNFSMILKVFYLLIIDFILFKYLRGTAKTIKPSVYVVHIIPPGHFINVLKS